MPYLGPSLRRRKPVRRPWVRGAVALVVSLIANTLLVVAVREGWRLEGPPQTKLVRPVAVAPLSAEQWAANRGASSPPIATAPSTPRSAPQATPRPPPERVPPPPPPPETPRPPGQVVDIGAANDQAPQDSRFVSERNNKVEKETRSRHARPGYAGAAPVPLPPAGEEVRPEGQGGDGGRTAEKEVIAAKPSPAAKPRDAGKRAEASAPDEGGKARRRESAAASAEKPQPDADVPGEREPRLSMNLDLGKLSTDRSGERGTREETPPAPPSDAGAGQPGDPGLPGRAGVRQPPVLRPSAEFYRGLGGGPAPDALEDVEEGEATWLNTREWKYAHFMNRLKRQVADHWHPNTVMEMRDPRGLMFGYRAYVTVVDVTLDDHGALRRITVVRPSGIEALDDAAVDSFKQAQPFVNPPRGLVDTNNEIKFAFRFIFDAR